MIYTTNNPPNRALQILLSILWIVLGIWILSEPSRAMVSIIRFVGVAMIVSAVMVFIFSRQNSNIMLQRLQTGGALVNLALGLVFLISPQVIVSFFLVIVGLLLLIIGIMGASQSYRLQGTFLSFAFLRNVLLVLIGLLMLVDPFDSASAITWMIGLAAIVFGVFNLTSRLSK
ncbi:MAG TPA: DUF308 domain-containing protein [Salinivirga sp.]|uniref:DUF308 domain-containing protein n=1 Tax=Salinivirga sp. TaxID=1970192 RepID=UPI002B46BC84|nr:DUF308 domain-containing protein [Salinivirga sp.]HKK59369.1 DUF308 domain-containing protein [Salinivirga sp.]